MSNDKKGQQGDPKKSADNLKKKILGSIKGGYTGEQTSHWILNMNDEALLSQQINVASESNNLLDLDVMKLIDVMFDDFQRYVFEYQRTPAGVGFILNCHRPTANDPPVKVEYGQVPILCQGHVSSAKWVMIVQGQVGKVIAYIVPVEFLVGFKATQNQFSPFVEAKAVAERGKSEWRIDEHSISKEMLPIISKRIFGALIKVERGEAKNTDKFVFDASEPEEEEYIEPVEERYKPQLLSDTNGPNQQRSTAQQQYQQPELGRSTGAPQPVPAYEQQRLHQAGSPAGAPQAAANQRFESQARPQAPAYQGPPAFQRSQTASQQQGAVYQQPQGMQPQAPYQQAEGQQQGLPYQPQTGGEQQGAYQQHGTASQQPTQVSAQQPQAGSQAQVQQYQQQPSQSHSPYQQQGSQPQSPYQQQGSQPQSPYQQQGSQPYQAQASPPAPYQQQLPHQGSQPVYQQPQGGSQQQSAYQTAAQHIPKGFSQQNPQQGQNTQQRAPQPGPQPQQMAQPQPAYQSPAPASINPVFDRNRLLVAASLDELVAKLDIELESLARIGMKAIQSQDMAAAQFTINRATKLKDVRQRVNDLSNEWKSSVS